MSYVVGIAWFEDEATYRKALSVFTDPENMPAAFEDWKGLVERQLELIRGGGNLALRADIDPEAFVAWCASRGLTRDAKGRTAFVRHVEIEYEKTGRGTILE
jgi:hypothetical protein